ncbi:lipopolysaccharide biosynthesis protein RfbH [Neisseriaceae bacterium TC5R-5]|nr:lipopolysaccharide biosynthesis protein RfbH [Neisseriaceae bacterium TC5R-5]
MTISVSALASARCFNPTSGQAQTVPVVILRVQGEQWQVLQLEQNLEHSLAMMGAGSALCLNLLTLPSSALEPIRQLSEQENAIISRYWARYWVKKHGQQQFDTPKPFVPGQSTVPPSGKVIGSPELMAMTEAVLDGWLTTGRFNEQFEAGLAASIGVPHVLSTNSGSSANLLAFMALTSPKLGERAIKPGDEVITVAAGFPTTVNPAIQFGAVPVFVDIELGSYNIDVAQVAAAIGPKTRAIMLAHTLGNPFDVKAIKRLADQHGLWLVEDCCDALGAQVDGHHVGTFGDLATLSFYPAHHITMGEGGAVFSRSAELMAIVESLRDWGRDCYCKTGCDNTCGKRFAWQLGGLPLGYDHKYIYSHAGYNLKITDMQAACGLAQLQRLPDFIRQRNANFAYLHQGLQKFADRLILPQATAGSSPSWFGFLITLKSEAACTRVDLLNYLDSKKIGTRLLFAGNLLQQPYMQGRHYRAINDLPNTNNVMLNTFWVGIYPGLGTEALDWIIQHIQAFLGEFD